MRSHLVVMARRPGLGIGKRRLAREIGDLAALQFQRGQLSSLLREVGGDPRWQTWFAWTPDYGPLPRQLGLRLPKHQRGQGRGDLGCRMSRLFRELPPGPLVIVGADIPQIRRHHIRLAFAALATHDWVFGPAEDGGYWLVGARRRKIPFRPFAGVRWSSSHALADTLSNLNGCSIALLEQLRDVDTAADLEGLARVR